MKTIEQSGIELSEKEVPKIKDDYTNGLRTGIEFGFEKGVEFAQRWISFTEKPEIGINVLAKKQGCDEVVIQIRQEIDIEILKQHFDFWRPIELK